MFHIQKTFSNPRLYSILHVRRGFRKLPLWAKGMHAIFLFNLVGAIASLIVASVPDIIVTPTNQMVLFTLDLIFCTIFAFEFISSFYSAPSYPSLLTLMNLIDFMSFFPFFVLCLTVFNQRIHPFNYQTVSSAIVFTINLSSYRFIRIFRVLRAFRYISMIPKLRMMTKALRESVDGVLALAVLLPFLLLVFSVLMFFAEQTGMNYINDAWYYHDGSLSAFQSITSGFWIIILMFTSLGLPADTPKTLPAKLVLTGAMVASLFLIAFPVTVVTIQLQQTVRYFKLKQRRKKFLKASEEADKDKKEKEPLDPEMKEDISDTPSTLLSKKEKNVDPTGIPNIPNDHSTLPSQSHSRAFSMEPWQETNVAHLAVSTAQNPSHFTDKDTPESILACPIESKTFDCYFESSETTPPLLVQQLDSQQPIDMKYVPKSKEFYLKAESQILAVNARCGVVGGKRIDEHGVSVLEIEKEMELSLHGRWPEKVVLRLNKKYLNTATQQVPSHSVMQTSDAFGSHKIVWTATSEQTILSLEMNQEEYLRRLIEKIALFN